MKILVTGGAGFIGSNFVRMALTDKFPDFNVDEIIVLDLLTYAGDEENLAPIATDKRYKFVKGDIRDLELAKKLMGQTDYVVHFAAESHVDRSIEGGSEFVSTNVMGTQVLLDAARNSNLKRFLHVSTDEVYGSISEGSWPEDHPLLPNSPYSASKAGSDFLVRAYNRTHKLDTVITRCSNNYGQYQFPEKVMPLFITNIIEGKKVPLYGNGLNVRDWLHVDDHCRGIALALTKGKSGEVYNIGGGTELTNVELTHKILAAMGVGEEFIQPVEDRKGHDLRYSVDITKINTELGYSTQVNFEEGLEKTINWYRNNEAWWRKHKQQAPAIK
ncbi:MAG: dTDP-glucose 4,6-dehydratase [Actinomycetota bacterium]|nr:dTDP-glucose 4,6-dehydratase [Actinomycetota bacterium]